MRRRPGPRRGDVDTRQDILDAARAAFAADGYGPATIRRIAADARVDPALIHHYFGTKADLYAATIEMPINPTLLSSTLAGVPAGRLGEAIARLFFSIWSDPDNRARLLAILSGAMTGHDAGVDAFTAFIEEGLLAAIVPDVVGEDRSMEVTLAAGHLVGVAILRYAFGIEPLASVTNDELVAMVAPRIQSYLTG